MTKLTAGKSVIRETASQERGDPLIVELHPRYLQIRVKGKRGEALNIEYDVLLAFARKLAWRRGAK